MAMAQTKRLAAMLLALLLTLFLLPSAHADGGVVSGTTVSGTVRVYLSSISNLTAVDLTIAGSYSVGGDANRALARGQNVRVSNSGGMLSMTVNGQTQTMGSRFKLRRHQTTGENGVRIAQARYPASLYPGDIEFIARGGNIQIIAHVFMEDYMLGVLPYEMDNSFPLEALKAQAVAARTYALKKMSAQAATYDVVDTTSDQVYNGTPAGNDRCAQAVRETSGIIGTVGGEYMASYYTASNGGQTESVKNAWGSGSYSYLQIKDDPYDLRNGASIAKSVTFYRNGTTSVSALTELLRTEAAAVVGAPSVQIRSINFVAPDEPKYAPPSRVYKNVLVGMTLEGYGDVTISLDYFSQVEGLCSMSINVLKNETLTVTETVGGYKLTARRFGHGVGMSQRGAQQMANEGISYDQILEFYYPGLTRTRYTMTRTLLAAIDGTTQTPDEPVTDAKIAVITLQNPLDSLNLRQQASTASPVLARMPHGTQVNLLEKLGDWSKIQYGTLTGYVMTGYLTIQEDSAEETPPAASGIGTATVALSDESQTLNLRAAPTTNSSVLARLRHGQTLTVLERYENWTYVQFGTANGYVMNDYIVYATDEEEKDDSTQNPPPGVSQNAVVRLQNADSKLNLRAGKSLTSGVLARLSAGETVSVIEWGAEWCQVSARGVTGYCATAYLSFDQNTTGNGTPVSSVAIVLPASGLNLRTAADENAGVIMTLPQGTMLTVTGEVRDNGMLPVLLGTLAGYVKSDYVYVTDQALATATPAPVQTPAPMETMQPSGNMRDAVVTAAGGLKLREQPSTDSRSLTTMPYGTTVAVSGEAVYGFYAVSYGELTGYASARYLRFDGGEAAPTVQPTAVPAASHPVTGRIGTVTAANGLNLRADSSEYANVVATLGYGVDVTVTGERINGFYPVRVGTLSGYVSADYVRFDSSETAAPIAVPTATPEPDTSGRRVVVNSDNGLNLRAQPNAGGDVLYVLPYGMVLNVLSENENGFLYVQWGGYTGYVSAEYVTPFGD